MNVKEVRRATDEETPEHWHRNPVALEMDNGDTIIPAKDPELNGAGDLLIVTEEGDWQGFDV